MSLQGGRLPTSSKGLGCLSLFALPFAAIGTAMAYLALQTLFAILIMERWPTVPATLLSVELKASGSRGSERAVASYSYVFEGKEYTGKRVSLYGADNLGTFHHDAYRELNDHLDRKAPYPVHVNPRAPTESILMPVLRWEAIGFYLVFAVLFGGAGWGILLSAFLRMRRVRREAALVQRYPTEPWKQRVEWSGSRVGSSKGMEAIGQTCLAVFWNVASFPVVLIVPREVANGRYVALSFLVIPFVGAGLLFWAGVSLARARRFGKTYLELDSMPGRPGERLRGNIHAPKGLEEASHVALTLKCERQHQVSSARHGTTTRTETLWTHHGAVPVVRGQTPTGDVMLAVAIDLPAGLPSSSRGPDDQYLWMLSAKASLKGADFAAEFEVPVFGQ